MTLQSRRYLSPLVALFSLVFAVALLAHEHFNGGVRSHHLLDRPDLPAISNWYGLVVLPLLGWLLGVRLRRRMALPGRSRLPVGVGISVACSVLYGAAMATAFAVSSTEVTLALFFGLFLLAVVLPLYRVEYIFGFVVGMAFIFGAVLPTLVAIVVAAVSALVHAAFRAARSAMRRRAGRSGVA